MTVDNMVSNTIKHVFEKVSKDVDHGPAGRQIDLRGVDSERWWTQVQLEPLGHRENSSVNEILWQYSLLTTLF